MSEFEEQGGVAFFIIYYSNRNLLYYLKLSVLMEFWNRKEQGGRKSFKYEELPKEYIINPRPGLFVPYLDMVNMDLSQREED